MVCLRNSLPKKDELTGNQPASSTGEEGKKNKTMPSAGGSRIGICFCAAGAVCLILFGVLTVIHPPSVSQINESSVIALNGTGILIALFVLLTIWGIVLIFKSK